MDKLYPARLHQKMDFICTLYMAPRHRSRFRHVDMTLDSTRSEDVTAKRLRRLIVSASFQSTLLVCKRENLARDSAFVPNPDPPSP